MGNQVTQLAEIATTANGLVGNAGRTDDIAAYARQFQKRRSARSSDRGGTDGDNPDAATDQDPAATPPASKRKSTGRHSRARTQHKAADVPLSSIETADTSRMHAPITPKCTGHTTFGAAHVALQGAATSPTRPVADSPVHSPVRSPVHSPVHSPVRSPVHSPLRTPIVTWEHGSRSRERTSVRRQPATPYHDDCDESDFDDMSGTIGDAFDELTEGAEVEDSIEVFLHASEPAGWMMPGQARVALQHR